MSLVTSICIIGKGMRLDADMDAFFLEFHAAIGKPGHPVPASISDHGVGNKGLEIEVYCVAYNYCDCDRFKAMFNAHDWCDRPVLVACWAESDLLSIGMGDDSTLEGMNDAI